MTIWQKRHHHPRAACSQHPADCRLRRCDSQWVACAASLAASPAIANPAASPFSSLRCLSKFAPASSSALATLPFL